jgi:drug/metabolite transporter (DMT)-like permease
MKSTLGLAPPRRGVALALMIAAPVLWSTAGVVTRHIERATAFEMVFWRSVFACVFVAGTVLFSSRQSPFRAMRAAGWPGALSAAMWAVMFSAFMLALSLISTANSLVVMSVSPLATALFALVFLSER